MEQSESIQNIATALCKAQSEMSGAKKGSTNPFFKSKYADLEEIISCAKEALMSNGLAYSQFPISQDNRAGVTTILMHADSGEWIKGNLLLTCSKNDPQGMGSAITYARRYALQSILGIPSEDDDGNKATRQQAPRKISATTPKHTPLNVINASQLKRLQTVNKKSIEDAKAIIAKYVFSSSKLITGDKYDQIINELSS